MLSSLLLICCSVVVVVAQECFPATPVYGTDENAWLVSDMLWVRQNYNATSHYVKRIKVCGPDKTFDGIQLVLSDDTGQIEHMTHIGSEQDCEYFSLPNETVFFETVVLGYDSNGPTWFRAILNTGFVFTRGVLKSTDRWARFTYTEEQRLIGLQGYENAVDIKALGFIKNECLPEELITPGNYTDNSTSQEQQMVDPSQWQEPQYTTVALVVPGKIEELVESPWHMSAVILAMFSLGLTCGLCSCCCLKLCLTRKRNKVFLRRLSQQRNTLVEAGLDYLSGQAAQNSLEEDADDDDEEAVVTNELQQEKDYRPVSAQSGRKDVHSSTLKVGGQAFSEFKQQQRRRTVEPKKGAQGKVQFAEEQAISKADQTMPRLGSQHRKSKKDEDDTITVDSDLMSNIAKSRLPDLESHEIHPGTKPYSTIDNAASVVVRPAVNTPQLEETKSGQDDTINLSESIHDYYHTED